MLPDNLSFLTSLDFIFYLIFGLAVLSGLIRGFKKTVFAFVTNLIFYAVFFLTIDQVVGFLWTFDMPWLGSVMSNIDPALANFTNFSDSLPTILGVFLGDTFDLTTASAHVMELAVGLGMFALKLVYTLLYFTVILLVWKLICWILQAILIHSQEGESKNRGMGAIFGTLNGALSVFVSLIMLGGFLSVVESMTTFLDATQTPTTQLAYVDRHELYEADYQIIPLATTEMPDITSELQMLHDMIDSYHANIFVQIADSITVTKEGTTEEIPLHLSLFDSVLSFDIDTTQVSIRYELAVYSQAMTVLIQDRKSTR
ncbi:MAG: hypothetical protein PHP32_06185, partial [Candidatus Izemoplasmatales bacterium]|nr:hypothetical protein [Candidatus Izemoplasmatales bacterium]